MLISHGLRCIFIHVFKTGGTSIKAALAEYADEPEQFLIRRPLSDAAAVNPIQQMWAAVRKHAPARRIQAELPAETFDSYYKFAFVRNPWEVQVAMYHFILQETTHPRHAFVHELGSFEEYLRWIVTEDRPYSSGAPKLQKDAVTDDHGNCIVDFIGRYERLREDFSTVCTTLKIKADLPHLNRSRHRDFRQYYDLETANMVRQRFHDDIEAFGYRLNAENVETERTRNGSAT